VESQHLTLKHFATLGMPPFRIYSQCLCRDSLWGIQILSPKAPRFLFLPRTKDELPPSFHLPSHPSTSRDDMGDLIICPILCYSNGTDKKMMMMVIMMMMINCWNRLLDSIDFCSLHNFRNSIDAIDCSLLTG